MLTIFRRCLLICTTALLLSSCNTMQVATEKSYKNQLDQLVGKPITAVVDSFGQADSISEAPNGNKLFVFAKSEIQQASEECKTDRYGFKHCVGGETVEKWCKTYIEVDDQKQVIAYSYKGNACATCSSKDVSVCVPEIKLNPFNNGITITP